tara:strand:+ start:7832 stop:8080 length:249 start_codon:yes stop_codon:yes gene_type:complete
MFEPEQNEVLESLGLTGRLIEGDLILIYLQAAEASLRKKSKDSYEKNDFANSIFKQAQAQFAETLIECIQKGSFDGDDRIFN